jgi:hypothetical protein
MNMQKIVLDVKKQCQNLYASKCGLWNSPSGWKPYDGAIVNDLNHPQ